MGVKDAKPGDAAALRRQAEETCRRREAENPSNPESLSSETAQLRLHELRVHQIELEMQNEELRRIQVELDAARARYFDLYDLAPVGYCTLSERGLILEANLTLSVMLGEPRGALVKERFSRFIRKEGQDLYYLHRKKLFNSGEPQAYELRMVKKDGTPFWAHLEAATAQEEDGERVCRVVLTDITDQVRAQEELGVRRQQLIQAEKMVSLGILVAGVAHEINNPNHSIMANVNALAEIWESTKPILDRFYQDYGDFVLGGFEYSECRDQVSTMFASAASNARRIKAIVTELRDFAQKTPEAEMVPVDVNALVKSALILVSRVVKESTDNFSVAYGKELPPVRGNFQRIEQVVINLVQNACQALASRDRAVTVATLHDPASRSVLIQVCDEGVGIPEDDVNKLGTPFFTTRRGLGGMGLGLWFSSNIAREHEGVLSFSPREGGGTRAVLTLPANGTLNAVEPMEYEL